MKKRFNIWHSFANQQKEICLFLHGLAASQTVFFLII